GVNNTGLENEVEMAGVSEVSLDNLENMELINEENMPNDMILLLKILIASTPLPDEKQHSTLANTNADSNFMNTNDNYVAFTDVSIVQEQSSFVPENNVENEEERVDDRSVDDLLLFINCGNEGLIVAPILDTSRPRGQQVMWYYITLFSHCIPRHAFHLWSLYDVIKEVDLLEKVGHFKETTVLLILTGGKLHAFVPVTGTGGIVAGASYFFKGGHQVNNFDITDGSLKGGCVDPSLGLKQRSLVRDDSRALEKAKMMHF
nr:hypothetical protein [Tanacetum cinerariifolium]